MAERVNMRCPKCGANMNHHADKVVYPVDAEQANHVDPALDGVVHEAHGCPGCGNVEFRRASPAR
jgi:hypothetical protein